MCQCSKPAPSPDLAYVLSALFRIADNLERIGDTLDDIADTLAADGEDEDEDTEMVAETTPALPTADEILAALTSGWGRIEAQPMHRHLVSNEPVHSHGLAQGTHGHYHGLAR